MKQGYVVWVGMFWSNV